MARRHMVPLLSAAVVAGCGASGDGSTGRATPAAGVRQAAVPVSPGAEATLMRFPGVGRLQVLCRERPSAAFRVAVRTATVAVDAARRSVRTLDPGEGLRTRLRRSDVQRWHVASSHGDGVRVVTVSVAVAPVRGGRGACLFSAQSIRADRAG